MQCWIDDPATGGIEDKIKMANICLKNQYSIVPTFHYAIFETNSEVLKNIYILIRL